MISNDSSPLSDGTEAQTNALACVMRSRAARDEAVAVLSATDFTTFFGRGLWNATMGLHADGLPVTPWTIAERANCSLSSVAACLDADTSGGTNADWVRLLRDESMRRHVRGSALRLVEHIDRNGFREDDVRGALSEMSLLLPSAARRDADDTIDDWIANTSTAYDWLVPWMLERGERLLLVGEEGKGKSVLLRQWAFQLACGCHWATGMPIEPARVLLVDAENSTKNIVRAAKWAWNSAVKYAEQHRGWDAARLMPKRMPNVDIVGNREARDTVANWIEKYRPDLLIIGPLYKIGRNTQRTYEDSAVAMTDVIDDWRDRYGIAVAMEHHAPKAADASGHRAIGPFGSSVWLRWPEVGLALTHYDRRDMEGDKPRHTCSEARTHFHVGTFRGSRGAHQFPGMFRHGSMNNDRWQWMPVVPTDDLGEYDASDSDEVF